MRNANWTSRDDRHPEDHHGQVVGGRRRGARTRARASRTRKLTICAEGLGDRQHDLGELDLLDEPLLAVTAPVELPTVAVNHLKGIIADEQEQREVRRAALEDDGHHEHVDQHRDERVEDPPHVAQHRVGALLLDLGADQVADEPAAREMSRAAPRMARGSGAISAAPEGSGRLVDDCHGCGNGSRPRSERQPGAGTVGGDAC